MTDHAAAQKKPRIKRPRHTTPIWQRLGLMAGISSLGLVFVCVVLAIMAFVPGGESPFASHADADTHAGRHRYG